MRRLRGDHRRRVAGRDARGEAALRDEVPLELLRVDALAVVADSFGAALNILENSRSKSMSSWATACRSVGVGVQQLRPGRAAQDGAELPPEVPGVGHRHVHALAGLGAVGVAGVAGDEHARQAGAGLVAGTSSNLSHSRWPISYTDHQPTSFTSSVYGCRIRLATVGELLRRDAAVVEHLAVVDLVQLDVEPDEVAALARDDQQVALVGGVDRALEPDVGEVGDGEDVHDAPGLVHRVADQLAADRGPDRRCGRRRSRRRTSPGSSRSPRSPRAVRCCSVTVTGCSARRRCRPSRSAACRP